MSNFSVAERIAARKALGMSSDEFNAHLKSQIGFWAKEKARLLKLSISMVAAKKSDEAVYEEYKAAEAKHNEAVSYAAKFGVTL